MRLFNRIFLGYHYCHSEVHPSGLSSISTIGGYLDGANRIQHGFHDESYNALFDILNYKSGSGYLDDDDCFLTLSNDKTMIKSITVSEL